MRVALFTKTFLEPTHHAIAQVINKLANYNFDIYAKAFTDKEFFSLDNINNRISFDEIDYFNFDSCRYSFVHAIFDGTTVFKAYDIAQILNIPFLISFHGGYDTNVKIFDNRYKSIILSMLENATEITVVCNLDRKRLRKIGLKRKINVIPVPIDLTLLPHPGPAKNNFNIISIGRLIEKKGIDMALQVLSKLPETYTLTIIGEGVLETGLKELSTHLKLSHRVKWLGRLDLESTLIELNKCNILLHPSKSAKDGNAEGTPQTILWAQALKITVVTSSSGSITDIVKNNETGIIVGHHEVEDYVDAIKKLDNKNFVDYLTANAYNQVASQNAIDNIQVRWEELYKKLMESNKRNPKILDKILFGNKYVIKSLKKAYKYLGIEPGSMIPFDNGGTSVLFLDGNPVRDNYIIKIPAYSKKIPKEHWILKHNILKEGQALSLLNNPAIPRLIHFDSGGEYLIREYIKGDKLSQLAPESPPEIKLKLFYALYNTANFVFREIHDNQSGKYVIRDFKPANLVCSRENFNFLYLVDIGSIREESSMIGNSLSNCRLGTGKWLYWSPEQLLENDTILNRRTDYFSFAASAFFTLTGKAPYSNTISERNKVMDKYFKEYENVPNELSKFSKIGELPGTLIDLVINCLHPDPDYRKFNLK